MQCVLTTHRSGSLGDRAAGYRKARAAALLPWSQALPLRAARAASASGRPTGVLVRAAEVGVLVR
jgi:hypothetical protein